MIVLPDSENCMIVASFVSTQYNMRRKDGQTDRQTDTAVAYTALAQLHSKLCRRTVKSTAVKLKAFRLTSDCLVKVSDDFSGL